MPTYFVRTNANERKTYVLSLDGNKKEKLAVLYSDFLIKSEAKKDFLKEEIIDAKTKKPIGILNFYQDKNILSLNFGKGFGKKEVASMNRNEEYRENGVSVAYKKLTKPMLLANPEYKYLEERGVTHAYFLSDKSSLSNLFCFEKDNELSGLIYLKDKKTNTPVIETALKGLVLVLAERISTQEYIFEFLRR